MSGNVASAKNVWLKISTPSTAGARAQAHRVKHVIRRLKTRRGVSTRTEINGQWRSRHALMTQCSQHLSCTCPLSVTHTTWAPDRQTGPYLMVRTVPLGSGSRGSVIRCSSFSSGAGSVPGLRRRGMTDTSSGVRGAAGCPQCRVIWPSPPAPARRG